MNKDIEKRNAELKADNEKEMSIFGVPIVFDTPTVINTPFGKFIEIIKSGSLDNADMSDVKLLVNHNLKDIPLARTKSKTMELNITNIGLEMSAKLPNTEQGKSLYSALKRGDIDGMSFAFDVDEEEFDENTNTRTIKSFKKIHEVSIVTFPAYEETKAEARNKFFKEQDSQEKEKLLLKIERILNYKGEI